jgi:ketosteroid isomerase-like protein
MNRIRLGACLGIRPGRAHGACEAQTRSEEEGDPGRSPTTSDAGSARNPHAPFGFRRRGAVCVVAAPRRCAAPDRVADASHPAPRRLERGRAQYPDRLLRVRVSAFALSMVLCQAAYAAAAPAAPPPPRDEVEKFARSYIEAGSSADPSIVMEMVSKRPEVSTIGMGNINRGWEAIRSEVVKLSATQGTHRISPGRMDITFLGEGYALVVAPVQIDLVIGEDQAEMGGAVTLVLEKSAGKWKVLHEHDSLQFPMGDIPGAAAD